MKALSRFFGRYPIPIAVAILAVFGAGAWTVTDYVQNTLKPERQATYLARVAAEISEGDTKLNRRRYDAAVAQYRYVQTVFDESLEPAQRSKLHHSIGVAHRRAAEKVNSKENLRLAVAALNEALALRLAEEAPADRADTHTELGLAHHAWFRETGDPAQLQQAIDAYGQALDIEPAESAPPRHARVQRLLGNAYRERIEGNLAGDPAAPALSAYKIAAAIFAAEYDAVALGRTRIDEALAHLALAAAASPLHNARRAVDALEGAIAAIDRERTPQDYGRAQKLLGDAYNIMSVNPPRNLRRDRAYQFEYRYESKARIAYQTAAKFGVYRRNTLAPSKALE